MSRPARLRNALAAGAVALLLAGCTGTAQTAATPVPTVTGTPVTQPCDELLPSSALSGLWSAYALDDDVTPSPVSAEIVGYDGRYCAWSDDEGSTFQIAIAHLDTAIIEALKNQTFTTSTAVPTYGKPPAVEGYFTRIDGDGDVAGDGVVDVFVDDFWIRASGAAFVEPGDPEPLIDAVVASITA